MADFAKQAKDLLKQAKQLLSSSSSSGSSSKDAAAEAWTLVRRVLARVDPGALDADADAGDQPKSDLPPVLTYQTLVLGALAAHRQQSTAQAQMSERLYRRAIALDPACLVAYQVGVELFEYLYSNFSSFFCFNFAGTPRFLPGPAGGCRGQQCRSVARVAAGLPTFHPAATNQRTGKVSDQR